MLTLLRYLYSWITVNTCAIFVCVYRWLVYILYRTSYTTAVLKYQTLHFTGKGKHGITNIQYESTEELLKWQRYCSKMTSSLRVFAVAHYVLIRLTMISSFIPTIHLPLVPWIRYYGNPLLPRLW